MAATNQSHSSTQPAPLRFPRLSYRNQGLDTESIDTESTNVSDVTISTNATSPLSPTFCSSPRELQSNNINSAKPPSSSATSMVPNRAGIPSKKKSGFLTGLFAKEPSAQALADYEKRLFKQGRNRTNTVGIPGVSSAKLPSTVPKVNSRWDGVPQTIKERERQKQEHQRSMSGHSRGASAVRSPGIDPRPTSTSTQQRRVSRGTLGGLSTHSSASSNRLADLYGWECSTFSSSSSAVVDFAAEHRPATARMQTSHSAPPATTKSEPLEGRPVLPPPIPRNRSTATQPYLEQRYPNLSDSLCPPSLSHSPALTPSESSPVTPEGSFPIEVFSAPTLETKPQDDIKTTIVEAPASVDQVIIKSAGSNILGPPATAKRKPKDALYLSGLGGPNTAGSDAQLRSILKAGPRKDTPPGSAASSYFPISSSPSPGVPQRRNSARERLGLGMAVKTQAIAPWLSPSQAGDAIMGEDERITTPTPPEGGQSLRRKGKTLSFRK